MIALAIVVGYVMLGVGTGRHIAGLARRYKIERSTMGPSYWTFDEPDICLPTIFGGFFWPIAWVYLLLIRPIVKVIGPGVGRWLSAPYRKAGQR